MNTATVNISGAQFSVELSGNNKEDQLGLLREVAAWAVIRQAHQDIRAGRPVRHEADIVYRARAALAQLRGVSDIAAWNMVGDTLDESNEDPAI